METHSSYLGNELITRYHMAITKETGIAGKVGVFVVHPTIAFLPLRSKSSQNCLRGIEVKIH
jgi:hypothetical protein